MNARKQQPFEPSQGWEMSVLYGAMKILRRRAKGAGCPPGRRLVMLAAADECERLQILIEAERASGVTA